MLSSRVVYDTKGDRGMNELIKISGGIVGAMTIFFIIVCLIDLKYGAGKDLHMVYGKKAKEVFNVD